MLPSSTSAHPRSRGENLDASKAPAHQPGSSPLTRGKRHVALLQVAIQGLIPAHAGKTQIASHAGLMA